MMIKCITKYENLEKELVNLPNVLKNSLQKEILTIKELDRNSKKFKNIVSNIQSIENAMYVIFSSYMCENYHESEVFMFINSTGEVVSNISGREIDLYDMIKDCEILIESKPY